MTAYADYAYYSGTYLGAAIASADFTRLALRASTVIDQITFGRAAPIVTAATDTTTIDAIQMATCAVAEEIQRAEASGGAVQSERVGNYSVTYAGQKSEKSQYANAAKQYLWATDLLYAGFADGEYSGDDDDED